MDWSYKNSTQIWIFSVGRGNAAFIRTGLNQGFILDMNATDFDVAEFIEQNFLHKLSSYKAHRIAQAVLSHPHGDHIAQCERLMKGKQLYPALLTCPHDKNFKDGSDSNERLNWQRIKNRLSDTAAVESYKKLYAGEGRYPPLQTISFDSTKTVPNIEYGIFYIQPPTCEKLHAIDHAYGNSTSMMFYLRHGSSSILFPGDMTPEGMQHILGEREGTQKRYTIFDRRIMAQPDHRDWHLKTTNQPGLKSLLRERGLSILVAPHHGLESCYSSDLYAAMRSGRPQLVIISERRKSKDDDSSGKVHQNYSKEVGASGLDVEVEGKRDPGRRRLTTVSGHHILIVFEGSGAPRVYAEKDPTKLFAKFRFLNRELTGGGWMGSLHCLNVGCADASVIITDTATFLVDCHNIGDYSNLLPTSKSLRGVFITHQHSDHYSGLEYLRDEGYAIDYLIYSPYERRYGDKSVTIEEWNEFNCLKDSFVAKGTEVRHPYRQGKFGGAAWWDTNGVKFEIIGPHQSVANSETRELHDACLVIKAILGKQACLFTGDASDANLEYIADNTNNFCNDILHASHHASLEGASLPFVKKCNARWTVISTASGKYQNVPHPTALKRYTENSREGVWRTDVNGSCKWTF